MDHEGHQLVLDTGSPVSFPDNLWGVAGEQLTDYVGCPVEGVLGMNVLKDKVLTLDFKRELYGLSDSNSSILTTDQLVDIDLTKTVPTVRVKLDDGTACIMAIDTGAPINYMRQDFICRDEECGEASDFFPIFGRFTTKLWRESIEMNRGQKVALEWGELPDQLDTVLTAWNVDGIIGTPFLSLAGQVTFDFPNGQMIYQ